MHIKVKPLRVLLTLMLIGMLCFNAISQMDATSVISMDSIPPLGVQGAPTAGYDPERLNGFFIQSKDAKVSLRLGAYTQFRYSLNSRENTPDSVETVTRGFNINLTRIFTEGNLGKNFGYYFLTQINSDGTVELEMAVMSLKFKNESYLWIGRMFMAVGREDWSWTQNIMAQDFSANDKTFALGTNYGAQYHSVVSDKFRFWASISNGAFGSGSSFPFAEQSDVLFGGRLEFNFVGPWENWEDMVGRRNKPFGVLIGIGPAYQINGKTKDSPLYSSGELNLDLSVNGNGYQAMIQGVVINKKSSDMDRYMNYGVYASGGYWVGNKLLAYLRFDLVDPGNQLGDLETYIAPGVGFGYYPFMKSNRWRISVEYNYLNATIDNTIVAPDQALGFLDSSYGSQSSLRFQAEFGF